MTALDRHDMRECQHDPPCGAPYCSACELVRLDSIVERQDAALRLPLMFHAGGDPRLLVETWQFITGTTEMTTKVMCDHIRRVIDEYEEMRSG